MLLYEPHCPLAQFQAPAMKVWGRKRAGVIGSKPFEYTAKLPAQRHGTWQIHATYWRWSSPGRSSYWRGSKPRQDHRQGRIRTYVLLMTLRRSGCPADRDGRDGDLGRLIRWPRWEYGLVHVCATGCGAQLARRSARLVDVRPPPCAHSARFLLLHHSRCGRVRGNALLGTKRAWRTFEARRKPVVATGKGPSADLRPIATCVRSQRAPKIGHPRTRNTNGRPLYAL